jgi:hypothetical protein
MMKQSLLYILLLICLIFLSSFQVFATGISVDAGLTPAEDRWIVRMQYRQMSMDAAMHTMDTDMLMAVAAYGVTRDVTLMIRQMAASRVMTMSMSDNRNTTSGLTDLAVLGKFGVYRKNTRHMILALAATIALKMPTGAEDISTDTWDWQAGIYGSWRSGRWGNDLNLTYTWNDFTGKEPSGISPGDVIGVDAAFSYQFSLGSSGNSSLTPVLELNYRYSTANKSEGQEVGGDGSIFFVSPGLKFTYDSIILEVLIQNPVNQTYENVEQNRRGLVGFRYMF